MEEIYIDKEPLRKEDIVRNGNKQYEIIEDTYKEGGFGRIYKARIYPSGRMVALKELCVRHHHLGTGILHTIPGTKTIVDLSDKMELLENKFFHECKVPYVVGFRNHNLPKIIDFPFVFMGRKLYAMEYVEGITLEQSVRENGVLDQREAGRYIIEICSVLEGSHKLGFAHRDVSPKNIIIRDHEAVLIDFGNANSYDEGLALDAIGDVPRNEVNESMLNDRRCYEELDDSSMTAYTPGYSDFRFKFKQGDVFSVAAVLHFMLTGMPPRVVGSDYNGDLLREHHVSPDVINVIVDTLNAPCEITDFMHSLRNVNYHRVSNNRLFE